MTLHAEFDAAKIHLHVTCIPLHPPLRRHARGADEPPLELAAVSPSVQASCC